MYVCVCNAVTERDIKDAARRGACSLDALCTELKVATCCGQCADCAQVILEEAIENAPHELPAPA